MITRADLKKIVMIGYLSDDMVDKLIPITDLLLFEENETIFRQGEPADRFYMLARGKVLLEQRITDKITVSSSAIKAGFSFGWSAMLNGENYSTDAICAESCRLYSFRGNKMKAVLDSDHSLGYIFSQRLLRIIKKRYDIRTEQFINTIRHHPDLSALL
jgi:CRP-like cAMP-binding protein